MKVVGVQKFHAYHHPLFLCDSSAYFAKIYIANCANINKCHTYYLFIFVFVIYYNSVYQSSLTKEDNLLVFKYEMLCGRGPILT